ncbi:vitamin K epoxide reductase family protein [Streptomyces soliscabiei]|uniref:vitamin K epoxide reductase family protein n=1 Tax=Streptomyces soliscabiei TaxID=588897 RepID=UPI0029BDC083|nr:vitamin K epoxide reductase family protein [Streptomyces sp. NY05-11A]MDX2680621.1 vitamin K epoxide reductase family protein [Streptomyces sp. NY05-11A]
MSAVAATGRAGQQQLPGSGRGGTCAGGRGTGAVLAVSGALGLLASWVITIDEFKIFEARAAGRTFTPSCSLNPVVSCGSVMESVQAHVFGFPNPLIGLVCYAVVVTLAVGLIAGVRYPAWIWAGLACGAVFGVSFCSWLQFQSLFRINALCLWCCLVWSVTILIFYRTAVHLIRHRMIPAPDALRRGLLEFSWVLPVLWTGLIGVAVLVRWWDFWMA